MNGRNHRWSQLFGITGLVLVLFALPVFAQGPNLIQNGDFEGGFVTGLGVANNWDTFSSGNVRAGFYDDTWELVVADGTHAQLLELIDATSQDAYAGIYQSVTLTPGQAYQLSFSGLVRSDEGSITASNYGYRMQYAIDQTGNTDWQAVTNWVELPWDEEPRTAPANGTAYTMHTETTTFTATTTSATVFFRAWKKWPDNHEGNYDIDAVSLQPFAGTAGTAGATLPETGGDTSGTSRLGKIAGISSTILLLMLVAGAFVNQRKQQNNP